MKNGEGTCETCGCEAALTAHHLVPKHVCRSSKYSKDLKTDESNVIMICRTCHDFIHATWSDQELRDLYPAKEKLLAAPEFAKFVAWRRKHPEFKGPSKMGAGRRRRR